MGTKTLLLIGGFVATIAFAYAIHPKSLEEKIAEAGIHLKPTLLPAGMWVTDGKPVDRFTIPTKEVPALMKLLRAEHYGEIHTGGLIVGVYVEDNWLYRPMSLEPGPEEVFIDQHHLETDSLVGILNRNRLVDKWDQALSRAYEFPIRFP